MVKVPPVKVEVEIVKESQDTYQFLAPTIKVPNSVRDVIIGDIFIQELVNEFITKNKAGAYTDRSVMKMYNFFLRSSDVENIKDDLKMLAV